MNEHIRWERVGLLMVAIAGIAIVAFVMGKNISSNERGVSQKVSEAQTRLLEKVAQNNNVYTSTKYSFEFQYPKSLGEYIAREEMSSDGISYTNFSLPTNDPTWIKSGLKEYIDFSVWIHPGTYTVPNPCGDDKECVPGFIEEVVARDAQFTYVMSLQVQSRPEDGSDKSGFREAVKSFHLVQTATNTTDWKTYRNEKYGFEFQYPNYLKLENTDDGIPQIFVMSFSNRQGMGNLENDDIVLGFKIAKKSMDLSEYLTEVKNMAKNGGFVVSRVKEIKIDGLDAIQQLEDVKVSDPGCYWKTYIKKNDRYDEITLMSAVCSNVFLNLESDYIRILSTLKYTK